MIQLRLSLSCALALALVLVACDADPAPVDRPDAHAPDDAPSADAPAIALDGGSDCDARIAAKQASCGAPPSLAQLYRDMWCGMSPTDADITCFVALTCEEMQAEIHAGNFPCLGGD